MPKGIIIKTSIGLTLIAIVFLVSHGAAQAGTGTTAFPRPPEISTAVGFWTRVYSEADSNSGFIHDNRALDIIYEVYPLPVHASPKRQHRMIRKRVRHYQQLLRNIAGTPDRQLDQEQRRVKQLWGSNVSASQIKKAADRVRFQRGQSDRMRAGLKRAARYEKRIRKILRENGVPEQLAALPHVESSYNPNVRSKVGAAGLWQIMPATGRRYLRVNNVVDERLDPYKATKAAAQLLKHNYSVLKSWPLAITAYNHGLSGVRRAVRKSGTTDIDEIIRTYNGRRFKFASRNFYPAFLAASDVAMRHGADIRRKIDAADVPVVVLNAFMPATAIVEGLGIDGRQLRKLNPDLAAAVWQGEKRIPKSYPLHIPSQKDVALLRAEVKALEERSGFADQIPDLFYRVQTGDSLGLIAQNHNTSIKTLVTLNNLRSRHRINAGQLLRIPKAGAATSADSLAVASTDAGHDRGRQSLSDEASPAQNQPTSEPVPASNSQAGPSVDSRNATQAPSVSAHAREAPAGKDESTPEENETVVIAQSDLAADPADYRVAADGTIEVQAGETLGHYAHWLKLPTQRLRELNDIGFNQHLIVGNRLRLAFSTVDAEVFERKRADHHARIQNLFFERHMITDVKTHALTNGDNLWELSMKTYQVPLWLLRQYNPDLTFDTVLSVSGSVRIPIVQISDGSARSQPEASSDALQEVAKLN